MSIFVDKHELVEKKDIVNPNLIQQSTSLVLNGYPALPEDFRIGKTYKTQINEKGPNYNAVWALSSNGNWGEYYEGSTFIKLFPNETYTFSIWLKSDAKIKSNPTAFNYNKSHLKQTFNLSVESYGGNEYKLYGTFKANSTDPTYCLVYFDLATLFDLTKSFNICIEKVKLERGTLSTALGELVFKSDYDKLLGRVAALEKKIEQH